MDKQKRKKNAQKRTKNEYCLNSPLVYPMVVFQNFRKIYAYFIFSSSSNLSILIAFRMFWKLRAPFKRFVIEVFRLGAGIAFSSFVKGGLKQENLIDKILV